jgi:hypothetical protein
MTEFENIIANKDLGCFSAKSPIELTQVGVTSVINPKHTKEDIFRATQFIWDSAPAIIAKDMVIGAGMMALPVVAAGISDNFTAGLLVGGAAIKKGIDSLASNKPRGGNSIT